MILRLLGIDWQNDFVHERGNLWVGPKAVVAAERLAKMIVRISTKIHSIDATLDSHSSLHIAHPIWWVDSNGNHPKAFTSITVADVEEGSWRTTNPQFLVRSYEYVKQLATTAQRQKRKTTRATLTVWNPHCLIGTWGHAIYEELARAFQVWESQFAAVDYHTKGSNMFTEHYSAIMADVPDPSDPTTMLDTSRGSVIDLATRSDLILLTGIASSHCLASTVFDMADNFPNPEETIKKMVLLLDAIAPVPGFEQFEEEFIHEMVGRGMQTSTTDKFLM